MAKQKSRASNESPYQIIQAGGTGTRNTRSTPFQDGHLLEFGLTISELKPDGGSVVAVACRFCTKFGREEKVGSKRKQTKNTKFFKAPFRPENYRNHLDGQHPSRWTEYNQLSLEGKRVFFDDVTPFRSSIRAYASESQAPIVVSIDSGIVDVIIEEVLLDDDDNDLAWVRAKLSCLQLNEAGTKYVLKIKNPIQFQLIVDYLSCGMSFRMVLSVLTMTKQRTGLASIGSCTPELPAKYARFVCAINLQKIKTLLSHSWTFSLALNMSTHLSISYLDTRIRLFYAGQIVNVHLLAIPMNESNTGEAMFQAIVPVLDVLCPNWREVMLGITTDGERKMTGVNKGLASSFQKACSSGFMRVWCGLHQLDLVLQKTFKATMDGRFYGFMTQTIRYLRRQATLIRILNSTAPLLQDTRWESMLRCCGWFKKYRVQISSHLVDKKPACKPPNEWWLYLALIEKLSSRAVITFRSLEGKTALITEQVAEFNRMSKELQLLFGVRAVTEEDHRNLEQLKTTHIISNNGTFVTDPNTILDLLRDNGNFAIGIMDSIGADESFKVAKDFAGVIANLIESVVIIEPERNQNNEPLEGHIPPALPRDLVKMKGRNLSALINIHRDRMRVNWTDAEIDTIEQEHSTLSDQYEGQEQFRRIIDDTSPETKTVTTFEDGWKGIDGKFPMLCRFAGGLATTFPGTSTVESDFSLLKWEKPTSKSRLTNFSLEGALHSKHFDMLDSFHTPGDIV